MAAPPTPMPTMAKVAITTRSPTIESSTPLSIQPMVTPSAPSQIAMIAAVSAAQMTP